MFIVLYLHPLECLSVILQLPPGHGTGGSEFFVLLQLMSCVEIASVLVVLEPRMIAVHSLYEN